MRVGVTGISSDLGRGLLPRLEADPLVDNVVVFDIARPEQLGRKSTYVRVDLTRPGMEEDLTRAFREQRLDVLYHLAFVNSRVHGAAFAHELEVIGSMHVLAAAQAVGLKRLIIPSLTALYGALANGPALFDEQHPLRGEGVRFVTDRVEVEHHIAAFAERNPHVHVLVLRFAPIVGAHADNPFTRLLRTGFVPTVLGFDPLWQVIHEEDAATALHLALTTKARGTFNIVGEGTAPFSTVVRLSGARAVPMAGPMLRATIKVLETAGVASVPVPLLDYLRYSLIADGTRARKALGFVPRVPFQEAMASMRERST
ncbi:MAG: NAD-dependent epimerase/dehydratase family protein [Myxococcota bacterium]